MVLISATVMSYVNIERLSTTTNVLTDSSVPVFVHAQEIDRRLTGVVQSLRAVENVRTADELQPIKISLETQMAYLKENAAALAQRETAPDAFGKMAGALADIETRIKDIVALKSQILSLKSSLDQVEEALKLSLESARTSLEKVAYEISIQLDMDVSKFSAALENFERVYSRNLRQANAITELTLEIESLIEKASRISRASSQEEITRIEKEMRFKSRGISVLLSQLRPSRARQALAEELLVIREWIFGADGMLALTAELQTARAALDVQKLRENGLIAAIAKSSDELVLGARNQMNQATAHVDLTAEKVVTFVVAASLASLMVFGVANVFVVERQINQRMSRLTKAVSAIAANETDYEVDIEGDDELGKMALALETFKATAAELRRSNAELEKFAYAAAHDLRSPLRAIQDISEWMMEDEENKLSEESTENMALLQSRVDRLNLLLTDLLAYSRVGKENEDLAQLALPDLVQGIEEMLDTQEKFRISYSGTRQELVTYATPLRQILLNLISNGIKHHDRSTGEIRVTGVAAEDRLYVTVEDDGPGIEPEYHDRIFGLFQTLRPRDEVEGSGLGLAIIWKLVDHYGGTISVTSNPATGRGTKFRFDMPIKPGAAQIQDIAA